MAPLPPEIQQSLTVQQIYAAYKAREEKRFSRRLGASIVGEECARKLWYSFHWCDQEEFSGRMLRLFETGHMAEDRFVENLAAIGCEVSGRQNEYVDLDGHFVCKIDGLTFGVPDAEKTPHVCEFKTHSSKSFREVETKGLKAGKPQHYAQCIVAMKLSGLKRCLYLAVNKDNDDLYAERLKWEDCREDAEAVLSRAKNIINAKTPPERINEDADFFKCRFCTFRKICHFKQMSLVNCRTCCHSSPAADGKWHCERWDGTIPDEHQPIGCDSHLYHPDLVQIGNVVDANQSENWIEYAKPNGERFRNGQGEHDFKSTVLRELPETLIVDEVEHAATA